MAGKGFIVDAPSTYISGVLALLRSLVRRLCDWLTVFICLLWTLLERRRESLGKRAIELPALLLGQVLLLQKRRTW